MNRAQPFLVDRRIDYQPSIPGAVVAAVRRLPVVGGATSLLLAYATSATAGYFYWLSAAHLYSARHLGASASITSCGLVVALLSSQAVAASVLVRMPRAAQQRPILQSAVCIAGATSAALGLLLVVLLPLFVGDLRIVQRPAVAATVVFLCVGQAMGLVADGSALALGRLRLLVARNAVFGFGKLALLIVVAAAGVSNGTVALVGSWAAMAFMSSAWSLKRLRKGTSGSGWAGAEIRRGLSAQTVTAVSGSLPPQLLPALVTAQAGATMSGYFALTWLLGGMCFSISPAVSQAILPTGQQHLRQSTRQAVLFIGVVLVLPVCLFLSCGAAILSFFGAKYAAYGAPLLVFLAVSTIPDAVTNIAVARWRVMERLRPAAVVNAVIALTALGLVAGPLDADRHGGVATIGMAWLIAQSVGCAVLAAMCVVGRCSGDRALVHSERAMAMEPGL